LGADYTTEIKISPLTSTLYRNDESLPSEVEILFGTAQIEVQSTPATFWSALKDVGGMISIMFFVAIIAGCRHTKQFNESLKKAFHRATKHHREGMTGAKDKPSIKEDLENMSITTSGTEKEEIEMQSKESKKKLDEEFYEYFSFGKYLELHQRVEYLEDELDRRKLVTKRQTSHYRRAFTHKNALYNGKEGFSSDEEEDEFKSLPAEIQVQQQ
jgi:hypothetical protein